MLLVYDPLTNPINQCDWAFPFLECVHIVSFAFSVGTITFVDVRLLGLGFGQQTSAKLLKNTNILSVVGLVIVISSGLLLFSTDPLHYYHNGAFRFKIIALVLAIVFNFTIHRRVALRAESASGATKVAGALSLLLWVCVVFGGVFYSFY